MVSGVLGGLEPAGGAWTRKVAYEVALEGTGQAIGFYAELIANEEADPDKIEQWRAEQRAWAARRRRLRLDDGPEIDAIYSEGEVLLAEPDEKVGETVRRKQELSEDENERIFRERIVPDELTSTQQEQPVAVIVAGQPGAGKATVNALACDVLLRHGRHPLTIGPDRYQPHWPVFRTPIDDGPTGYLSADGLSWMAKALTYARTQRFDVVMEAPLLAQDDVEHAAREFKSAGYRVEVAILAVPEAASRFGVLDRHLRGLEVYGYGRLADPELHDSAYRRVLEMAETIDREQYADHVAVLRSDGQVLHQQVSGTAEVVERERSRLWTAAESRQFLEGVAELRRIGRSAPIEWIQREAAEAERLVRKLVAPYIHPDAVTLHIATAGVLPPDA
ncbi:zeta toxin family protein [Kribbella catacumbae]|uniref:zeta toxin family protein n=1 Tax=Kribbella catacumbae TaxID=460086 RepID=UPI00035F3907|nr:zeta toxin family protein [Kribbella catacumbae]